MQKPLFFQGEIENASQKAWPCARDEIKMSKNQCLFKDFFWKCQKTNSFLMIFFGNVKNTMFFKDFFCKCLKTQCFLMFFW